MKIVLAAALVLLTGLGACSLPRAAGRAETLVLPYRALGFEVAAFELIGFERYQWKHNTCGCAFEKDEIKVVVYRGISAKEVARRFPVVEAEKQDYRYLAYKDAISYLNALIKDHESDEVLRQYAVPLQDTRRRILDELGP